MKTKLEVEAISNNQLMPILEQMHQIGPLEHGEIHCAICGKELDMSNIGAIKPQEDINGVKRVSICCDNYECISKFIE